MGHRVLHSSLSELPLQQEPIIQSVLPWLMSGTRHYRTRFSSQETGGSVANLNMIASGELEMGMSNENVAYTAGLGKDPFKNPIDLKGGWILNNSNAIIVAMGDSGITSVSQLKGKKVSLGAPGSSANVFGELILASEGLEKGDYQQVFMGWQESADAMNDGFIDAALMVGGQPFPLLHPSRSGQMCRYLPSIPSVFVS